MSYHCPDCKGQIELHGTGWWSHVDWADCWRLSMDGPGECEACEGTRDGTDPDFCADCIADMASKRAA